MNKNLTIAIVAAVVLIGGISAWLIFKPKNHDSQADMPNNLHGVVPTPSNSPDVNMTKSALVEVAIEDFSFSPANITVKKGTTVVWTNKDSAGHNVVSNSSAPAGGPPAEAPLLGKDQQFTFTYDTVGTFDYYCTPHPYMSGRVTVEE